MEVLHQVFNWVTIVLAIGGIMVAMVGIMWDKIADAMHFFEIDLSPNNMASKAIWVGVAMAAVGFAMVYLSPYR